MSRQRILFLCTGNSCRSQMAEAWARRLHGDRYSIESAGIERHGMNARAVQVMAELGMDLDLQFSKTLDELESLDFDAVFTVCGHAHETCPVFPGPNRVVHRGFDDPPRLTADMDNEEEILAVYRRVRDEIGTWIRLLPQELESDNPEA